MNIARELYGVMVRRTARKSGKPFFGCRRYPACRGKRFWGDTHG